MLCVGNIQKRWDLLNQAVVYVIIALGGMFNVDSIMEQLEKALKKIQILHYRNYVNYFRDLYHSVKSQNQQYSYRQFSNDLGFQRSNYLHLIVTEKRKLSSKKVEQISSILKFSEKEKLHFSNMVDILNKKPGAERNKLVKEVVRKGGKPGARRLQKKQYAYFSHWYYPVIREMVELKDFKEDLDWIVDRLNKSITKIQVKEALKTLEDLGLINRNVDGKLRVTSKSISTPKEIGSECVVTYHKEMLELASQSIDICKSKNRDISSITMGVDLTTARKIKKEMQDFRTYIQELIEQSGDGTEVFQLNMQWFPLTIIKEDKEPE